jgi:hypothetical protein
MADENSSLETEQPQKGSPISLPPGIMGPPPALSVATMAMNGPPGELVSRNKQFAEGEGDPSFCGHCSAPYIHDRNSGNQIGVYIDDTTPHRRMWIMTALEHHPSPQIVFVGIAPEEDHTTLDSPDIGVPREIGPPHLLRLKEWLPWGMGGPWQAYGRVPACGPGNGYILQKYWHGYFGHNPPSLICFTTILRQAVSHRPRFIFYV